MCTLRKGDKEMTLGTLMNRTLEADGTLHNQKLTAHAYLTFDFFHREGRLPVKSGRIYKVVHKADDSKVCMWCVESIEDVTDLPVSALPQVFKDWEIGRESAGTAPFDLSDLDRKLWVLQNEVMWISISVDQRAREVGRQSSQRRAAIQTGKGRIWCRLLNREDKQSR